jgi:endonuclease YncB( thermonuclease family)
MTPEILRAHSPDLTPRRARRRWGAVRALLVLAWLAAACGPGGSAGVPGATVAPSMAAPTATATRTPATPAASPTAATDPEGQAAKVVRVIDGDTIEVEIDGKPVRLRYIGIDAPERGQPGFEESHAANAALVDGQTVYLVKDVSETDPFGRLLRYVYLADGTMVNAELVRRGFAQAVTYPPDVAHQELFLALQREAREAGSGLWAGTDPAAEPPPVRIAEIFYDGLVQLVESDEYVVIVNEGDEPVDVTGWQIQAGSPSQAFTFPAFILQPGQSCRIYTNMLPEEPCVFSFGIEQAIWRNSGDCGILYDARLNEVDRVCYTN